MKLYKQSILTFGFITILFGVIIFYLHYYCIDNNENQFRLNVCLALCGSALITVLSSVLSYRYERKKTLESFWYHTKRLLKFLSKYQDNMSLEQKIRFFIDFYEFDIDLWDTDYGNMDFFFERKHKNREYIYKKIYSPIISFNKLVENHIWHFRWHIDGSGKNDRVMEDFVAELEKILLYKVKRIVPARFGYDEQPSGIMITEQKLVQEINKEMNGHYYEIMLGKRLANQIRKELENDNQTQNANA